MKRLSIYKRLVLPVCIAFVGMFSSCSMFDDFLTVYPTNQITGEQFWEDQNDLTSVLASCYKQMTTSSVVQRMSVWGEIRSDNFVLKDESDENLKDIMNANLLPTNSWYDWSSFYTGIAFCNLVLSKGEEVVAKDPGFSMGDWKPMAAECKALRALYYFYLVRAFRDVPFNLSADDTSAGVRNPMPQVDAETILSFLIKDLEACKDEGMTKYADEKSNRNRITRDAIYTILADIYLWRASKNTPADSMAKYPGQAQADYQRVIDLCDYVIASKLQNFVEEHETNYYGYHDATRVNIYPLLMPRTIGRVEDTEYNELFGEGESIESIFEVAFRGTSEGNSNLAVQKFYGYRDGSLQAGLLGASTVYSAVDNRPDQAGNHAYSQTDLRFAEAVRYNGSSSGSTAGSPQIIKYLTKSVQVIDATNVNKTATGNTDNVSYGSLRQKDRIDANWILYRASDVMLMKAEALACLYNNSYQFFPEDKEKMGEAYNLVYAIFDRSNPMIETQYKLKATSYEAGATMEDFVMRERQREFFAEGKRWFDLVRYAMRRNSTQAMLNLLVVKYTSNASAIKAKLATMNSLFSPVYKEEIKVNPVLKQNPAWEVDETIVRN